MTAIATNEWWTHPEAEEAQRTMVCRVCASDTKVQQWGGRWWTICTKRHTHIGLCERETEAQP